jgi:hypothetical protein
MKSSVNTIELVRASVKVVSREDKTLSSPSHIIKEMEGFRVRLRTQKELFPNDEFWMVVDADRWGGNLKSAISQCHNAKFHTAISNPCFEIWLLLHYQDLSQTKCNTLTSKQSINIELSTFNLSGRNEKDYLPHTERAIENAQKLDDNVNEAITNNVGTKVYKLIQTLKLFAR